ncbi:MAG: HD domain-containing protein [Turicibacter sp.]
MLTKILNDSVIINRYQAIEEMEEQTGGWAYHNLTHVQNVATLTEQLLKDSNNDVLFIQEAKIAALLHDIGSLEGKEGHAKRSCEYVKNYLQQNQLSLNYESSVLDAIRDHSHGFETDNIMTLALILADKLDITKRRLAPAGYEINGLNEIQYIESIHVSTINQTLYIHFIAQPDFNQVAFENFYFAKKVFQAIISYSNKLNLTYAVTLNHQKWCID